MNDPSEIPVLPGHDKVIRRRAMRAFLFAMLFILLGFYLGDRFGPVVKVVSVLGFLISFGVGISAGWRAKHARCPNCGSSMVQSWDGKAINSTGVFTCPGCSSRWRTDVVVARLHPD